MGKRQSFPKTILVQLLHHWKSHCNNMSKKSPAKQLFPQLCWFIWSGLCLNLTQCLLSSERWRHAAYDETLLTSAQKHMSKLKPCCNTPWKTLKVSTEALLIKLNNPAPGPKVNFLIYMLFFSSLRSRAPMTEDDPP